MNISGANFIVGVVALFAGVQAPSLAVTSSTRTQVARPDRNAALRTSRFPVVVLSNATHGHGAGVSATSGGSSTPSSSLKTSSSPQGLLSGCTVEANNSPSCAIPSGWTLAAAQGFESGAIPRSQYFSNTTAVESGFAHTGTHAAVGRYSGGDQRVFWALRGDAINSLGTYISWWEYDEPQGKLNQDFYMMRRVLYGKRGAYIADVVLDILPPGVNNCLFNCTNQTIALGAEGSGGQPNFIDYSAPGSGVPGWGSWTQWEVLLQLNAPGQSNGRMQVWRNGVRVYSDTKKNIIGMYKGYETSDLEVGGVYTYLVWWLDSAHTRCAKGHSRYTTNYGNWSQPNPCPNQAPPSGYGVPFKRYFDDIIVLKR